MGYLTGARGRNMFETEYVKLLECPYDRAVAFATEASAKGWIDFKWIGDVVEALFPKHVSSDELEQAAKAGETAETDETDVAGGRETKTRKEGKASKRSKAGGGKGEEGGRR
jgi:hypothetical protein